MKSSFISVIVPIYNCSDYIEDTLKSILNQCYKDFEVLLIDDKSTDGSIEVIKNVIKDDDRFRIIYLEENSGAAVSRNTGIKEAEGEFIAILG